MKNVLLFSANDFTEIEYCFKCRTTFAWHHKAEDPRCNHLKLLDAKAEAIEEGLILA